MVNEAIRQLVEYGLAKKLIHPSDAIYARNQLLLVMGLDEYEDAEGAPGRKLHEILEILTEDAVRRGVCEDNGTARELFDTKLMGCLTPRPSEVQWTFADRYDRLGAEAATDWYYQFSQDTNYIRRDRIAKDVKWVTSTAYGDLDITINLSKPEKDPKAIAAATKMEQSSYPTCMLCKENEGYAGRVNHPARQNHRVIPICLEGENAFLQYSPYVYYNEHCIVFDEAHTPMKISEHKFRRLFDFVKKFPHYFLGSNSDLPIAGGSILTHEHFQGGRYTFAMAKAEIEEYVKFEGFEDVTAGIVKWPMSVIRLQGKDTDRICTLAGKILAKWRDYTDEDAFIYAITDGEIHNTITPIARYVNGCYELDLVLRNNITTEEYPDGFYHPHPEYHNIKKENIGLIEVMGLAVLPSRLKTEMAILRDAIVEGKDVSADERIAKHSAWAEKIKAKYSDINAENCEKILQDEIGLVFTSILEQCGVFDRTETGKQQFRKFISSVK